MDPATLAVVERAGVLALLADFDPVIVGTFPLGLERPGSDVDIVCCAADLDGFLARVEALFGDRPRFGVYRRPADERQPEAAVASFLLDDVPVELFAQSVPTHRQQAYRHFVVESRLLDLGGPELRDRVRAHRRRAESVEVAFARVLDLSGDPYAAVMDLEHESDEQLKIRTEKAITQS